MRLKPLHTVDALYITASMTRPTQVLTGAELARIHRNQGYSQIAVHYVIERDGTVFEGRSRTIPGVLAGKHDSHTYQVCLLGGVDDALNPAWNFTSEQKRALDHLRSELGLRPIYARDFPHPQE